MMMFWIVLPPQTLRSSSSGTDCIGWVMLLACQTNGRRRIFCMGNWQSALEELVAITTGRRGRSVVREGQLRGDKLIELLIINIIIYLGTHPVFCISPMRVLRRIPTV
jgi:hypothetical protein